MKTTHTPGPWVTGDDHPSVCRMTDDGSQQICAMDICGFLVGEPRANADLIAAAPELLNAIEYVLSQLAPPGATDAQCRLYSDALHPTDDDKTVVDYLRGVIAKAKGQAFNCGSAADR